MASRPSGRKQPRPLQLATSTPSNREPELAPGLTGSRKAIGFLLRKAYQRNMMIWQSMVIDPQLTSVQAAAMAVLYDHGPSSLTDLGREAAMDPATTRGVVDRLKERHMISLADDTTDKRKVIVRLEDKGRQLVEAMFSVRDKITDATLKPLNIAERVALEYLLTKISEGDQP